MVFIATSNNIISGRSVLLLEETGFELTTLVVIGIDYIGIAINLTAMQSRPRLPLGTVQKSKNNCWKNGKIDTPNTYICMPSHFPGLFNKLTGLN